MNDWASINVFGRLKLCWLRQYLPYQHGIPSHYVLQKVFALLDPVRSANFKDWVNLMAQLTGGEVIAMDRKLSADLITRSQAGQPFMWCQPMLPATGSDKTKVIANAIRRHWVVENNHHWTLIWFLRKMIHSKKKGNSPINYNIIAGLAIIKEKLNQKAVNHKNENALL